MSDRCLAAGWAWLCGLYGDVGVGGGELHGA